MLRSTKGISSHKREKVSTMKARITVLLVCACVFLGFPQESPAQWEKAASPGDHGITSFAVKETLLFAAAGENGVFLSTTNGDSWKVVNVGLPAKANCRCLAVSGGNLLVGTEEHGVFLSVNNGGWWKAVNAGLPDKAAIYGLALSGTTLFAGTSEGVFLSTDNAAEWKAASTGLPEGKGVNCFAVSEPNLYASTWDCVYLSTDNGAGWAPVDKGLPKDVSIYCLAVSEGGLFAGTEMNRILFYDNTRGRWEAVKGIPEAEVYCFAASGENLFAGTGGGLDMMFVEGKMRSIPHGAGVLLSTDKGGHWEKINAGFPPAPKAPASLLKGRIGFYIERFAVCAPYLFAGTEKGEIYRLPLSKVASKESRSPEGAEETGEKRL
jgi:hypothetical protein